MNPHRALVDDFYRSILFDLPFMGMDGPKDEELIALGNQRNTVET